MKILELRLTNFRNHKKLRLDLNHNIVLLTGPNGAGKTNILEAVYALSTGKSIKARYDRDMINYTAQFSTAGADIENSSGKYLLEMQVIKDDSFSNISSKKTKVNKVPKSLASFSGIFNSVMFSPEDLNIITGSPSETRKYMEHGTYIQEQRVKLFNFFNKKLPSAVEKLNGKNTEVEIKYLMNEISEERLKKHEDNEIHAKTTLVGPHRDDFSIFHKSHNLSEFGSRGEQRSVMLALKLCEINFIEQENNERPVLLLDDIFSELDENHRSSVFNILEQQQTIITSTEPPDFLSSKANA